MPKRISGIRLKKCIKCERLLPLYVFGSWVDKRDGRKYYRSYCKECARESTKKWNREHKDYLAQKYKDWRESLKAVVYTHYGNKCACCGEDNLLFLSIDHVNNDGYLIRSRKEGVRNLKISGQWYKHIIDSDFPTDLQLLCFNCNCGKQRNGGVCPHGNSGAFSTTPVAS